MMSQMMSQMMNLQFTIPPNLSFEQAIALTQELLAANPSEDILESAIAALIQTMNGARGFFVTFLTGHSELADSPTVAILKGLRSNPTAIADLMVKNIAMPTAMKLTHDRNGHTDLSANSALTQKRSIHLVQQLALPEITHLLESLKTATQQSLTETTSKSDQIKEYQGFLDRWGYDKEQRIAIIQAIDITLALEAN
jgi:hypothetical protein